MTTRLVRLPGRLLIALPVLSLALGAIAWLRFGIDMPWYDDWRGYAEGTIDSLAPAYLFRPVNHTMVPVGWALDALAQRYLDGNSIAYQFLSMVVVLGLLLLLQWKLLNRALGNALHAAICFTFTLLMLQPGSYWGLDNLAYHQAVPLVFILGALLLMSGPGPGRPWHGPALAMLGLLAGFTYISGAFGGLAAGIAWLAVARWCHSGQTRRRFLREGAWFTVACGLAAAAQAYFSLFKFGETHASVPLALPTEAQFWAYYLGKLGRSLLLPSHWPLTSAIVTGIACAIALASAAFLLRRASSAAATPQEKQVASIHVPLAAMVVVYLMIIAAARTNLRPPEIQGLRGIFAYGFLRFHFFWATLIWPWVAAVLLVLGGAWLGRGGSLRAVAPAMIFAVLMFLGGAFDHMSKMREVGEARASVANCLLQELQKGGEVRCNWLLPPRPGDPVPDSYPAYLYARKIGASFVRNFPILPAGKRRDTIAPFFTMDGSTARPRMRELEALGNGVFRAAGADPQLYIQTHQPQIMRRCTTLDVEVEMKATARDTLQLFYAPAGDSEAYSETTSVTAPVGVGGAGWQTLGFRLESNSGFFESLRLDPVTHPQLLEIRAIRLYCVWEMR